jgi:hypothetical protein
VCGTRTRPYRKWSSAAGAAPPNRPASEVAVAENRHPTLPRENSSQEAVPR